MITRCGKKVFNAANKDSAMIEDGSNYGDFLLKTIDGAKDEFTADELKTLQGRCTAIKGDRGQARELGEGVPGCGSTPSAGRRRRFDRWHDGRRQCFERGDEVPHFTARTWMATT